MPTLGAQRLQDWTGHRLGGNDPGGLLPPTTVYASASPRANGCRVPPSRSSTRSHKILSLSATRIGVQHSLEVVRTILNRAARSYRDNDGQPTARNDLTTWAICGFGGSVRRTWSAIARSRCDGFAATIPPLYDQPQTKTVTSTKLVPWIAIPFFVASHPNRSLCSLLIECRQRRRSVHGKEHLDRSHEATR